MSVEGIPIQATELYLRLRNNYVKERGTIGTSSSGNMLPLTYAHDLIALPAMLVPFAVKSLEEHALQRRPLVWPQPSAALLFASGVQIVGASDPAAEQEEIGNARAYTRSLTDWLRLGVTDPKNPKEPLVRVIKSVGLDHRYWFWGGNVGHTAAARSLMTEWNELVRRASLLFPPPGSPHLTLESARQFWSAFYRAAFACQFQVAMDVTTTAEIQDKAKQVIKESGEVVKDAADEIGELAAGVADTAGEVLGKFGSSFLANVGLVGAIFVVGLFVAKSKGLI